MDYLASYDLESPEMCVDAARAVASVHERLGLPGTFFVVGECLEKHGRELRGILDNDLFDLQSHTYSHKMFRALADAPGAPDADGTYEVTQGVKLVRDVLGRPCEGLRTGFGYQGGLAGLPTVLKACVDVGLKYVSSDLRGPGDTLPSPLKGPYTYTAQGHPALWELPVHGWHDNVLKGFAKGVPLLSYPPLEEWHIPPRVPKTAAELTAHNLLWVDKASEAGLPFVSFAFHPWSLIKYDANLRELDLIFEGLVERGVPVVSCTEAYRKLRETA